MNYNISSVFGVSRFYVEQGSILLKKDRKINATLQQSQKLIYAKLLNANVSLIHKDSHTLSDLQQQWSLFTGFGHGPSSGKSMCSEKKPS